MKKDYEELRLEADRLKGEWAINKDTLTGDERIILKRKVVFAIREAQTAAAHLITVYSAQINGYVNDLIDVGLAEEKRNG